MMPTRQCRWTVLSVVIGVTVATGTTARSATADSDLARRRTPVVDVFEASRDAVVNISATKIIEVSTHGGIFDFSDMFNMLPRRRYKARSAGSGFVIHPDGYIITNAHVVSRTQDPKIIFADGTEAAATLIASDDQHDLAVLKIDAGRPLPRLALGRSDDLMVGETVIAIGNPLGYQNTVTAGIVSALDRELVFSGDRGDITYQGLIQTDAAINPGNSGGPLLNALGQLVGINTAIRGDAQNMGFAIPVNHLRAFLPNILSPERLNRVNVGLRVGGRGQPHAVEVTKDGPAAQAGVQPGDTVLSIDGVPIVDGLDFYFEMLTRKAGQAVRLGLNRDGRQLDARLTLTAVPKPDGKALAQRKLGLILDEVRSDDGTTAALLIRQVESGSAADRISVRAGDILWQIGRFHVSTLDQLGQLLTAVQTGDTFIVRVIRQQGPVLRTLTGQMEVR